MLGKVSLIGLLGFLASASLAQAAGYETVSKSASGVEGRAEIAEASAIYRI